MDKVINWFCLTAAIFSFTFYPMLTLLDVRDSLRHIDINLQKIEKKINEQIFHIPKGIDR